jgi:hypothetical protein
MSFKLMNHLVLATEDQFRSKAGPCRIYGGQSGTGADISQSILLLPS